MKVIRLPRELERDPNSVVTVGTFDGVHRAHREIIREVVNRARVREGRSVVVSFDPHPRTVVAPKGPVKLLSTLEERIARIEALGVDVLLLINFTYEFSRLSHREFYRSYVVDAIGVAEVVLGYDHMFGRDREAGTEAVVRMGKAFDFSVFVVHQVMVNNVVVSSTEIRKALVEGRIEHAEELLGYPYGFHGRVVQGDGRGKSIGFPTANIEPASPMKLLPARGVYVVTARVQHEQYFGMMNIGVRPTVTEVPREVLEVHLFDFEGDLYGKTLEVTFHHRLRNEQKFGSVEELTRQLHSDKEQAMARLAGHAKRT